MAVVLDASAVLAWVRDEPGGDRVMSAVQHGALVSAVNWAEVLTRLVQSSGGRFAVSTHAVPFRDEGPLTLVAFDDQQARETARLWRHTHSL